MNTNYLEPESFQRRHIGPQQRDLQPMLEVLGVRSLDELMDETIPADIRLRNPLDLPPALDEHSFLNRLRDIARKNVVYKSFLGQGYYDCVVPSVIQRNIFENPGWYTQYTPYQAEISQGRLEALLTFQTMVRDLTGMEVANASLLDEATAAAEAMAMASGVVNRPRNGPPRTRFFVSERCFVQTIEVLKTRAWASGFELVIGDHETATLDSSFFGALLQYPDGEGRVVDYESFVRRAHELGMLVVVAADLLSLALLKPPGEFGADVVVGSAQRFGVPMGYGGPHAAYLATRNEYIRHIPGRIIGVSIDARNNTAYRMTLQTREQHIRREKATSNICTAQALLAIMAAMYAVYHGPEGLRRIATRIHLLARMLNLELSELGFQQLNAVYFDTLKVAASTPLVAERILHLAAERHINLRRIDGLHIGISFDETKTVEDVALLRGIFAGATGNSSAPPDLRTKHAGLRLNIPPSLQRTSPFLQHPVFNSYHSETEMMRYIKSLEQRDLSLTHSMIPLGSCTMKLNAATELLPVSWPEFSALHPFAPPEQAAGYHEIFREFERDLCTITGLAAVSLQPNSGAQGEWTGLLVIRAYHEDRGEGGRNVVLIPASAHGTNPASAVMAGMKVVVVECDEAGNIDLRDLEAKASAHSRTLAALMVTYPSTYGVFEARIKEICDIVHKFGGQVYMDGANMNAQVGLTSPAAIGADVCHLNLHKTFSIPHGGGGPGMGPICVAEHLAPYLPAHPFGKTGGAKGITAVASAPWSSASIVLISYAYIRMLGSDGMTEATKYAIANANYLKRKLEQSYPVLYQGERGRIAHEFILNTRGFKESANVDVEDIAKRLMDYGFHAPTVSFPVPGTLMIEPTESESKAELDRFVDALVAIRAEIQEILDGKADPHDNVLKNAPHTAEEIASDHWNHPYSRARAAYPLPYVRKRKFWPPVSRINNTYGDRNIMCACPPVEDYAEAAS